MPSPDFKRSDRISDLIKEEISNILCFEVKDPRVKGLTVLKVCLLYTSPSPRDGLLARMPSSA